jgi:oligopeptidase B
MPPKAKQIPHAMTVHGDTRLDNYYWLRDDTRSQPDVLEYLQAENEYGRCIMASQQALQDSLLEEIISRIPQRGFQRPTLRMAIAIATSLSRGVSIPYTNASLRCLLNGMSGRCCWMRISAL